MSNLPPAWSTVSTTSNADRRVFYDRWKAPGDRALYKNIASRETTPPTDRFVAAEYALEGSSLKLSYSLPDSFCRHFENRIINVHPSLIPSFCGEGFYGLRVHEAALAKGVKVTGATVHFVSEVVDGGAIIAQKAVEVEDGDTPETLQKRVMQNAEWILLPQAVSDFCAGRLRVDGAIVHKN